MGKVKSPMSSADKFKYIFQEVVPLPRQNNQILGDASSQPRWPRSPEPFRDAVVSTKKKWQQRRSLLSLSPASKSLVQNQKFYLELAFRECL